VNTNLKIKVCGITDLKQLQELEQMEVQYAGLIFYQQSKRFAPALEQDAGMIRRLKIAKAGVFVNAPFDQVMEKVQLYGLDLVQLHGNEQPELCAMLQKEVAVVKAFGVAGDTSVDSMVGTYMDSCDFFLFDTHSENYGGSGKPFNWNVLEAATIDKPFFLSGGIAPDDAARIKAFDHPCLYAIDINSRFETAPGKKDMKLVNSFIAGLKNETN
jgi:phosphoribosylanthranilate isomerase